VPKLESSSDQKGARGAVEFVIRGAQNVRKRRTETCNSRPIRKKHGVLFQRDTRTFNRSEAD
jgi:hypothetical protein